MPLYHVIVTMGLLIEEPGTGFRYVGMVYGESV